MAIILAITKWKHYLLGSRFIIKTDQKALKHLLEQKITTYLQQKVVTKLLGLDYIIQYKQGKENVVADALSRAQLEPDQLMSISTVQPSWMHDVTGSYLQDKDLQHIVAGIVINPADFPMHEYRKGILRYKHKIILGNDQELRQKAITTLRDSSIGGHSGISEAQGIVLLEGNEKGSWTQINMDFIEGLPPSNKKHAILVVVDRFTKYSHFMALSHPFTTLTVAQLFLDHVYRLHGMPTHIISDRDRVFLSAIWQELFTKLRTKLHCSTSYHHQSDGQTERVNQCLETYLRCMCSSRPKDWNKWLPLVEFWYNTNFHSSLKLTPFEALYGYKPPHLPATTYLKEVKIEAKDILEQRKQLTELIKDNLTLAQKRMKSFADKSRTARSFEVGDQVFLKLQPYRQNSESLRKHLKLAAKYYGPFEVIQEIGILNKRTTPLPNGSFPVHPIAILNKRTIKRAGKHIYQVLIQWNHSTPQEATWEDYYNI
ncbi:hypothetical protein LIER_39712 [Lithospermum erythrorhizon]|uniref:Integrase catalytic domain-containing protein n=1 Tax=Lithospermum erythrorhizon TaxID=34254 RepID=A0AAV3QJ07_LITER